MSVKIDHTVDACGMQCPMPLLKAKQTLNAMQAGDVLEVLATDSGSFKDVPAFARLSSHELLLAEALEGRYRYLLKKG